MALILKNITGSSVQIEDLGEITIPAGTQIEIDPIDRLKFARSEDLEDLLSAGTLVLEHEGINLTESEAIRLIKRISNLKLSESTVLKGQSIKELNLIGDYTLSIADGVATINFAPSANDGAGALLQPVFVYGGNAENKWLRYSENNLETTEDTPFVVPYDCKLIGITFTNKKSDGDGDLEIYKALKDFGATRSLVYTYSITDSKVSLDTSISGGPTFAAGDKISLFMDKTGQKTEKVGVTLYLLTTNMDGTINSEQYET
jgi:hypothetical protein